MALRHGSSQTLGLVDVAATLEAFEQINSCSIQLGLKMLPRKGETFLIMEAKAVEVSPLSLEVKVLAWVSLTFSASQYQSLDTAAFRLLYMLDGRLADQGLSGDNKKGRSAPAK